MTDLIVTNGCRSWRRPFFFCDATYCTAAPYAFEAHGARVPPYRPYWYGLFTSMAVLMLRNRFLLNYLLGIASIVIGAGVTSATDSLLPLAMGGAVAVMCTFSLVRAICLGKVKAATRRKD